MKERLAQMLSKFLQRTAIAARLLSLILGKPSFGGAAPREFSVQSKTNVPPLMSARRNDSAHTDPQELARRMILGAGVSRKESAGVLLTGVREVNQ
jgi:hypothetical protein